MKRFFAYIRVSSAKQGEQGVSLGEQRRAIERYAAQHSLEIIAWFEEVETAAKRGRPIFTKMLKLLRAGAADGLIMHKIDRSARNYYDWAEISDLADLGIAVHYAQENLELGSRGRRLMADIQAVFAADYIRNLREEVRKGQEGRLREGLTPWAAPLGYVNNGRGGKVKTIDPVKGPLVIQAFELYASGGYSLDTLVEEMYRRGLRNLRGDRVSKNGLSSVLSNPFYIGLIAHRKKGGPVHKGVHMPLVSIHLFEIVQKRLKGKLQQKVKQHVFLYRRMFTCAQCGHFLTPEHQKGHIYYRCHTRDCSRPCVREEALDAAIAKALNLLSYSEKEREVLEAFAAEILGEQTREAEKAREVWKAQLGNVKARHARLVDALLDGTLDKDTFESRKRALLLEERGIEEKLAQDMHPAHKSERMKSIFELAFSASLSHSKANDEEKREHLQILTSNRSVDGKNVVVELSFPFRLLAHGEVVTECAPSRPTSRSGQILPTRKELLSNRALRHIIENLHSWLALNPTAHLSASWMIQRLQL